MPRQRWAVPCAAHKTNGEPCKAWAVRGTWPGVCRVHGGMAPQVRTAAVGRLELAKIYAGLYRRLHEATAAMVERLADPEVRESLYREAMAEIEATLPSKPPKPPKPAKPRRHRMHKDSARFFHEQRAARERKREEKEQEAWLTRTGLADSAGRLAG